MMARIFGPWTANVRITLLVALLVAGFGASAYWNLKNRKLAPAAIRAGYYPVAPYHVPAADGSLKGLTTEVFNEAGARCGLRIEWVRLLETPDHSLSKGTIDIYPVMKETPERRGTIHVTEPWLATDSSVLMRRHSPAEQSTDAGAPGDWFAGRKLLHTPLAVPAKLAKETFPRSIRVGFRAGYRDAMRMICAGEADGLFADSRMMQSEILNSPRECAAVPLRVLTVPGSRTLVGVASLPEKQALAEALREQIGGMAKDGTLSRIFSRWLMTAGQESEAILEVFEHRRRSGHLWSWVAVLACAFVVVMSQALRLKQLRDADLEAGAFKSAILASIGSEIRAPLHGVHNLCMRLLESGISGPERETAETIHASVRAVDALLEDLASYTSAGGTGLAGDSKPYELRQLAASVIELLQPSATQRNIELALDFPGGRDIWLRGDPKRTRQLLFGAIGTCVHISGPGQIRLAIGTAAGTPGTLRVSLGLHIPECSLETDRCEDLCAPQDRRFTRFGRSTAGLGLALARKLAEEAGGGLTATRLQDRGFQIDFSFVSRTAPPQQRTQTQRSSAQKEHVMAPTTSSIQSEAALSEAVDRVRLLLVEDNPVNQKLATLLLKKLGFDVDIANNGVEALSALEQRRYPAILMDCQMPEMDGYEATRQIRIKEGEAARTPIIAVTANALPSDRDRCMEVGMDDFIAKPIRPDLLKQALDRWLPLAPLANASPAEDPVPAP